jgi:hypothetical protein
MAERLWNPNINIDTAIANVMHRLVAQQRRMQERGFKVCPVTVGICERNPSICWS